MLDLISFIFHLLVVDPTTNMLVATARVFGGNLGVAIIVYTLLLKLITWPLTASQFRASRAMQSIQPKIQEINKKYKGKDPKKLQAETMALYKEAGVNPLGCILPMIVQMPIWIALYSVIRITAGTTPESLVTLSQRLYPISFVHQAVPLNTHFLIWNLGQNDVTYILPVLVAASMYVQQKLMTPAPAPGPVTEQQAQQQQTQQMMTWMMPLMFGAFTLSVPSGLGVYWFISNVAGFVLQYFYMGRKVDWRNLLQFGPQTAQTPAAIKARATKQKADSDSGSNGIALTKSSSPSDGADRTSADIQVTKSGEAAMPGPQSTRRTKNGRRRAKR